MNSSGVKLKRLHMKMIRRSLRNKNIYRETKSLLIAARYNVIWTNYIEVKKLEKL